MQIFDAGPDGAVGGGDDTLIGSGGTDSSGNFNDGQNGIAVSPALVAGQKIFAFDADHNIAGKVVVVGASAQVPTVNAWGAALLAVSLGLALGLRTWMARAAAHKR